MASAYDTLDPKLYTVAWIAPLEIEAQAALHMLDDMHEGRFPVTRGDDYVFIGGTVCGHNVVIATLPAGQEYGTGSAAALSSQLKKSFPNLWFGLLVGVAAGLPDLSRNPPQDIRLGDVLVALPEGDTPALVAYDLGKQTGKDGFRPLRLGHVLANTETVVRSAIGRIRLFSPHDARVFRAYYEDIEHRDHRNGAFTDPGQDKDKLFFVNEHGHEKETIRMKRPESERTRVWYGPIGSGEKLMRDSRQRNELRDRYNIIGLEMEAAGTMNRINVGVIRGVCDYGDEKKNKDWQPYAAAMAAAYAKAVLREISQHVHEQDDINSDDDEAGSGAIRERLETHGRHRQENIVGHPRGRSFKQKNREPESESTPLMQGSHHNALLEEQLRPIPLWPEFETERPGVVTKYLKRSDIPAQFRPRNKWWDLSKTQDPRTIVIYGLPGVGKSQVCLKAIIENQHRFRGIFYVDATNPTTADNTYLEILRACQPHIPREGLDLEEHIRSTRGWLASQHQPWLLMIDNADSFDLSLNRYIPTRGPGMILITTTDERLAMCSHHFHKLNAMRNEDSVRLLLRYQRPEIILSVEEVKRAKELAVNVLGGLPLAISQAGSYIFTTRSTYTEYLKEFTESPQASLCYQAQPKQWSLRQRPLWKTLSLSINRIPELKEKGSGLAVELLRTLSFLNHDGIHEQLFQEAWANMRGSPDLSKHLTFWDARSRCWDTPDMRSAIVILCRYSLLTQSLQAKRQYSMHSLVHTFCKESLSPEQRNQYAFRAACLIALALIGIKSPMSWIENPSGFALQNSLLPHIRTNTVNHIEGIFGHRSDDNIQTGAEIILLFAKAYFATGYFSDARSLLAKTSVVLDAHKYSRRHDGIILRVNGQLATCEARLGRDWKALELRRGILHAEKRMDPQNTNNICVAIMNLADSLWNTGNQQEALKIAQEALALREKELPSGDPKLLRTRRKIAEYHHGLGQNLRALQFREQVFQEAQSLDCHSDMDVLELLTSKGALADSYQWCGDWKRTLQMRQDVYYRRQRILGPSHIDTILAYDSLLGIRSLIADPGEQPNICRLREFSLDRWRKLLGKFHPHTLEARINLGRSYMATRKWTKAQLHFETVLRIREGMFQERQDMGNVLGQLSSMNNVAKLLSKAQWRIESKALARATSIREKAVKLATEWLGPQHAVTIRHENYLATCLSLQGQYDKAMEIRKAILGRLDDGIEPNDARILKTNSLLASDLTRSGKHQESINIREQLLQLHADTAGPDTLDTMHVAKKLAIDLATRTADKPEVNYERAISLFQKVWRFQSQRFGPVHRETLDTWTELWCVLILSGRRQEAEEQELSISHCYDEKHKDSKKVNNSGGESCAESCSSTEFSMGFRHRWRLVASRKERRYRAIDSPRELEEPRHSREAPETDSLSSDVQITMESVESQDNVIEAGMRRGPETRHTHEVNPIHSIQVAVLMRNVVMEYAHLQIGLNIGYAADAAV